MRTAVALLVIVAGSGCRAPTWPDIEPYCVNHAPTRPIAGGDGPSFDEICAGVAHSLCDQWQRCGCDDGSGSVELVACRGRASSRCARFIGGDDVEDALARRTVVRSGAEIAAFMAELSAATEGCVPVELDLSGIVVGTIADLSPCTDISGAFTECLDGSSCQRWPLAGPGGAPPGRYCARDESVTGPTQRLGERCNGYSGRGCGPGLRCAPVCGGEQFDGVCVDLAPLDGTCRWASDCASGSCSLPAGSDAYHYAQRGQCATPGVLGIDTPCTSHEACESGFCDRGLARSATIIVGGRCADPRPLGDECSASIECASGACTDFRVVGVRRCSLSGVPCFTGTECTSEADDGCILAAERGTCGLPLADGETCSAAIDCASGWCTSADGGGPTCAARPTDLPLNAACDVDDQCAEGRCVGYRCAPPLAALDEACTSWRDCESRSCVAGRCAAEVCSARIDPTGHGAYWRMPPVLTPR